MNKRSMREIILNNQYTYACRKEAIAFRHAMRMVAANYPDSHLVTYFRREMRCSAVLMAGHAKILKSITIR